MEKNNLSNKEAREGRKEERKEKRAERKTKRQSKPKKALDISIDTKKVDVDIDRDEAGNLEVNIDAPNWDAKYTKDAASGKVTLEFDLEDDKEYLFEGNGKNRKLPKGTILKLTGAVIKTFLRKKLGNLKK